MKYHLPNILTISRILIIPVFLLMLLFRSPQERWLFLIIFTYASITDFLDGHLARSYNITSTFGRIFDSIADKLLVITVAIVITVRDLNILWFMLVGTMVILFRELLVSGLRESLIEQNTSLFVTKIAKYKTALQLVALGFLIVGGRENSFYLYIQYIGVILLYISTILSILSGLQYVKKVSNHL